MKYLKKLFYLIVDKVTNKVSAKDFQLDPNTIRQRAENGDQNAQFLVAFGVEEGRFGFSIDPSAAKKWLHLLTQDPSTPPGYTATAYQYIGLRSYKKALLYLAYAELDGYIPGHYLLALTKYKILLIEENQIQMNRIHKEARREVIRIIKMCCREGYVPALAFLGERYFDGWGVKWDPKKGLELILQAAEQGDCPAKIYLGKLYEQGILKKIQVNMLEAERWYKSAVEQGSIEARHLLHKIEQRGQVIAWPVKDLKKLLKITIQRGNKQYPGSHWTLKNESDDTLVIEENGVPVFTLTGITKNENVIVKFNNESKLSKRAAMFTLSICASPIVLDSTSLDNMNILLIEAETLNIDSKVDKKVNIEFSKNTLERFKDKGEQLNSYPIVKAAIEHQIKK